MTGGPTPFRLTLSSRTLPRRLAIFVAALLVIHLGLQTVNHLHHEVPWDLHLVFDVDEEPTVPTWYSSAALLLASYLLFFIAGHERRVGSKDAAHWLGLAIGFAWLSLDEIAALHEVLNTFIDVEWTIYGAIVVAIVGILYVPFLLRLGAAHRWRFLVAGAVYVGGAVVVEHLTGPRYFHYDMDTMPYAVATAIEEGLEMYGIVLFLRALLIWMEERQAAAGATLEVAVEDSR